jgi:hypothetical protein
MRVTYNSWAMVSDPLTNITTSVQGYSTLEVSNPNNLAVRFARSDLDVQHSRFSIGKVTVPAVTVEGSGAVTALNLTGTMDSINPIVGTHLHLPSDHTDPHRSPHIS